MKGPGRSDQERSAEKPQFEGAKYRGDFKDWSTSFEKSRIVVTCCSAAGSGLRDALFFT